MRTHRSDQGSVRPGHGQWPALDTVALGPAVGALNAHD